MSTKMGVVLISAVVGLGIGIAIANAISTPEPLPDNLPNLENAPLVPHQDYPDNTCARCHSDDPNRPDVSIPITPHPERTLCGQCHLPMRPDAPLFVETTWRP